MEPTRGSEGGARAGAYRREDASPDPWLLFPDFLLGTRALWFLGFFLGVLWLQDLLGLGVTSSRL